MFGQQLPTTSENKKVTVKRINSILSILNAAPKYGMNDENQNRKVFENNFINDIVLIM